MCRSAEEKGQEGKEKEKDNCGVEMSEGEATEERIKKSIQSISQSVGPARFLRRLPSAPISFLLSILPFPLHPPKSYSPLSLSRYSAPGTDRCNPGKKVGEKVDENGTKKARSRGSRRRD